MMDTQLVRVVDYCGSYWNRGFHHGVRWVTIRGGVFISVVEFVCAAISNLAHFGVQSARAHCPRGSACPNTPLYEISSHNMFGGSVHPGYRLLL